jgi:hypothetical protein
MMKNICFINVSGFFYSGSSAMVDLLKEFKSFYESNAEIRFIKDPYGIAQMENALVNNWELINSSAAISDFLELCRKGCRNGKGLFAPAGFNLKKTISGDFLKITEDYIEDLTDYSYKKDFYHYKFKKPYLKYVFDRYRWAIEYLSKGNLKTANRNIATCYFAHPTQERFNTATQRYFDRLFENHVSDGADESFIILDQAISPNNTQVIHRYFHKSKMIIIDRDPRDMYVDSIQWGDGMERHYQTKEAAERYILQAKALRENIILDSDILYVRFEDLIINYDETRLKILHFLGLEEKDHILKKKFLKPEVSIKNIGIWRKFYDDCHEAIDAIKDALPKLCYDSSALYKDKE